MKYKVGDKVRLKSAEELRKIGWCEERANKYDSQLVIIRKISDNLRYIAEPLDMNIDFEIWTVWDEDIKDRADSERLNDKELYSLNELQSKVEEFKEYLEGFCSKADIELSIKFSVEKDKPKVFISDINFENTKEVEMVKEILIKR